MMTERSYPAFNRVNISAVETISNFSTIIGTFEGGIKIIDIR